MQSSLTHAIEIGYFLYAVCGQRQLSVEETVQLTYQVFEQLYSSLV